MTISRNGCFQKQISFYTKEDAGLLFREEEEGEGFRVTLLCLVALFTSKQLFKAKPTTLQALHVGKVLRKGL